MFYVLTAVATLVAVAVAARQFPDLFDKAVALVRK